MSSPPFEKRSLAHEQNLNGEPSVVTFDQLRNASPQPTDGYPVYSVPNAKFPQTATNNQFQSTDQKLPSYSSSVVLPNYPAPNSKQGPSKSDCYICGISASVGDRLIFPCNCDKGAHLDCLNDKLERERDAALSSGAQPPIEKCADCGFIYNIERFRWAKVLESAWVKALIALLLFFLFWFIISSISYAADKSNQRAAVFFGILIERLQFTILGVPGPYWLFSLIILSLLGLVIILLSCCLPSGSQSSWSCVGLAALGADFSVAGEGMVLLGFLVIFFSFFILTWFLSAWICRYLRDRVLDSPKHIYGSTPPRQPLETA